MTENSGPPENGEPADPKRNLTDLYEKMSKTLRSNLERAGTLTEDVFERALKESQELTLKVRDHYGGDIKKVSDFIRRDWYEAIRYTRDQTRKSLDLERIQVGIMGVLSRMAQTAGSQLENFASRMQERLTYKTGEIAGAGTLECKQCGQILLYEKPTRIPPCPKCRKTLFSRSF